MQSNRTEQLSKVEGAPTASSDPIAATMTLPPGVTHSESAPISSEIPPELAEHPRYRIVELIGRGGMGAVYLAEHRLMQRPVALKVINPKLVASKSAVERFRREVQAAARLDHPNIVRAYDAEQAGNVHFLVMEYANGIDLQKELERRGPLPIREACDYIRQVAVGLQHAHENGMVHRDIKPHNLMVVSNRATGGESSLSAGPQIKILDFGLASLTGVTDVTVGDGSTGDSAGSLTQAGTVMGTPDYMAPEQGRDARSADIRADIYSLGCTLYTLLAGRVPFPGGTAFEKIAAQVERTPQPITELRKEVSPALVSVIDRMMAKDPVRRYQTPAEVAAAMSPFAMLAVPSETKRWTGRHTLLAGTVAAIVLLLLGIAYFNANKREIKLLSVAGVSPDGSAKQPQNPRVPRKRPIPTDEIAPRHREAINKGLTYLVKSQHTDGHWGANGGQYPVAITALAGMAMLMEGSTIHDGDYAPSLRKAVDWLIAQAQSSGLLVDVKRNDDSRYMFGHGYSLMFLATVYGQEEPGELRDKLHQVLTKAIEFTAAAKTRNGGWGYVTAVEGSHFDECATTIPQLQSLRAARNAGLNVSRKILDADYLRKFTGPNGGVLYTLTGGLSERPPLTAAALAGCEFDSGLAAKWLTFCQKNIPLDARRVAFDEYTHYYYAQALYVLGEKGYERLFPKSNTDVQLTWSKYRAAVFDAIVSKQAADGSWEGGLVGPVYSTACYLTVLQLDNAAVPIYQR